MIGAVESQVWRGVRVFGDNPAQAMQLLNRTNLKG